MYAYYLIKIKGDNMQLKITIKDINRTKGYHFIRHYSFKDSSYSVFVEKIIGSDKELISLSRYKIRLETNTRTIIFIVRERASFYELYDGREYFIESYNTFQKCKNILIGLISTEVIKEQKFFEAERQAEIEFKQIIIGE